VVFQNCQKCVSTSLEFNIDATEEKIQDILKSRAKCARKKLEIKFERNQYQSFEKT